MNYHQLKAPALPYYEYEPDRFRPRCQHPDESDASRNQHRCYFNLITDSEIHPCALAREKSPKSAPHRVKCLGTKQQPHGF